MALSEDRHVGDFRLELQLFCVSSFAARPGPACGGWATDRIRDRRFWAAAASEQLLDDHASLKFPAKSTPNVEGAGEREGEGQRCGSASRVDETD